MWAGRYDEGNWFHFATQKKVTHPVTDVEFSYDGVALRNAPTLQLVLIVKEQNESDQRAACVYVCVCVCVCRNTGSSLLWFSAAPRG